MIVLAPMLPVLGPDLRWGLTVTRVARSKFQNSEKLLSQSETIRNFSFKIRKKSETIVSYKLVDDVLKSYPYFS